MKWVWLFTAGGAGTLLRALSVQLIHGRSVTTLPLGTLAVNVLGCVAIGWLATWSEARGSLDPELRWILLTGFLGGFTTFSAFGLETWQLGESGQLPAALGYVLASVALGGGGVAAGVALARWAH